MAKSVYSVITDNIKDGSLPEDFNIQSYFNGDEKVVLVDGAIDGIIMDKIGIRTPGAAVYRLITDGIAAIAEGDNVGAEKILSKFPRNASAMSSIAAIQDYVMNNQKTVPPEKLYDAATYMLFNSSSIKCVQIALLLLELLRISGGEDAENLKTAIRRLGLCEEFSLYVMSNMCRAEWENANGEVFELAKKLRGWGKIAMIDHLKPETEEIRNWIFYEGTENDIHNAYLSGFCWDNSGAEEILFGMPSRKEYDRISFMLDVMTNDEIGEGLSCYENANYIILRFLELSKKTALSEDNKRAIYNIMKWAADKRDFEGKYEIMGLCSEFLGSNMPKASFLQ